MTMTFQRSSPLPPVNTPTEPGARLRLDFLDGLRGLAALYVVNHHILQNVGWNRHYATDLPWAAAEVVNLMRYGHFAVGLFIVLSGFCLMLPVLRTEGHEVPGGFGGFVRRRARRILPAYYAAVVFSLAVIFLVPATKNGGLDNFDPDQVVSHLLLVHNLHPDWIYGINGPMWSVATEWQIYFAFFLVLLPVWRRWGSAAAVGVAFGSGVGAFALFPEELYLACPWYLGLFAMGMAAATLATSADPRAERLRRTRWPWAAAVAVPLAVVWVVMSYFPQWTWYDQEAELIGEAVVPLDALFGVAAAAFIARAASRRLSGTGGPAVRLLVRALESRPAVALGACSYSLYLVHIVAIKLVRVLWLDHADLSRTGEYLAMLAVAVPLSLGLAYAFHRLFERPFLGGGRPETRPRPGVVVTRVAATTN